ncbi:MAG: hypothetical protein WCX71_02975 [Candidatus Buchananbacteria bacterium]
MGLFDSPKVFTTHEQIKEALFKINSLDYKEREIVYQALLDKLSQGGVSQEEYRNIIRKLREEKLISEIDKENLFGLIE